MKPTQKPAETKSEAKKAKLNSDQKLDREKFEKARKALFEYWRN